MRQWRLRWLWITRARDGTVVWLSIAGRKPLAHLPRWRRRLLHLPSVRWRLWPRPWNFNGPTAGWRTEYRRVRDQRNELFFRQQDTARELEALARKLRQQADGVFVEL